MSFLESPRFPDNVQYNTIGGPFFNVDIVRNESGRELRIPRRDIALHRFNVNHVKTVTGFEEILGFVLALGGPEHEFRFKDWRDYKSVGVDSTPAFDDIQIGTGDGATGTFQLSKVYGPTGASPALSYSRDINKPVSSAFLFGVAGTGKTLGVHANLATDTGVLTFTTGNIPTTGQAVTWGGEFDVPVRIDDQGFETNYTTCNIQSFALPLVETLPAAT